ncbi:hypothetical protein C8A03DRAFT_32839 [Achaetomium macrosporum]|uniref:NAD-dependent epimerase/dehydratase domain-containing protein n=1 Tax=Achaetomium macrosporum TaxID=79813 RepID=A0AAN7CC82_9PEZI|nr:hypothetical protein C8A03DRAFT_32839 [Achaetomium macrosporum]
MGGSFLAQLLASSNPKIRELSFSAVVRKQEQADVLANHGVNAILIQDLDDSAALKRAASEHDIVIHSANDFHPASAQALIEGLAERKKTTGREVYYIQTSGTSNLASQPLTNPHLPPAPPNNNPNGRDIFSDTSNIHQYLLSREALEPYAQRITDLTVLRTGKATGVRTIIVMSPTVYGVGLGLFNKRSIQRPLLIRGALAKGRAVYVGDGAGEWDHVHVQDLAELYELLVKKVGRPHSWKELAEAVGKAGYELGALETAGPVEMSVAEFAREWLGGNEKLAELGFTSRSVTDAKRSRSLGWQPRKTDEDWWASFKEEFAAISAQTKA